MSKAAIFSKIRKGLGRQEATAEQRAAVAKRLNEHPCATIPARGQGDAAHQRSVFKAMALEASAEIIELTPNDNLAEHIGQRLAQQGITELVSASDSELAKLDWSVAPELSVQQRVAQVGDRASLTLAFAGIAETGTLMLHSREESPTTLNFLPDLHLVVLRMSQIVGYYEQAWQLIRDAFGKEMPRTVNMITGPSRSADIEQRLQMGAHGPKELVILLINDQ